VLKKTSAEGNKGPRQKEVGKNISKIDNRRKLMCAPLKEQVNL
jgi:hypothetical protein